MALAELAVLTKIGDTHQTLGERVYRELRRSLGEGVLPSGARLTVVELARSMAVSRSPVVEAVSRLRAEGLLSQLPQGGFVVPQLSEREIVELRDARMMCQLHCIRSTILKITDEQIRAILADVSRYRVDDVDETLRRRGSGIAGALVALADSRVISDWFELLDIRLQHYRLVRHQVLNPDPTWQATSEKHHSMILSALSVRDLGAVEDAIRMHTKWSIARAIEVERRNSARAHVSTGAADGF